MTLLAGWGWMTVKYLDLADVEEILGCVNESYATFSDLLLMSVTWIDSVRFLTGWISRDFNKNMFMKCDIASNVCKPVRAQRHQMVNSCCNYKTLNFVSTSNFSILQLLDCLTVRIIVSILQA